MMLDRQGGKIVFECDACDETFTPSVGEDDFSGSVAELKRDGWAIKKIAGEWVHECPKCKGKR